MARKKFHFDFNEDAEPVEELHRFRQAVVEHFKTTEAIMEFIRSAPTREEFLANLDAKEKAKNTASKPAKRRNAGKSSSLKTPRMRGKPATPSLHA